MKNLHYITAALLGITLCACQSASSHAAMTLDSCVEHDAQNEATLSSGEAGHDWTTADRPTLYVDNRVSDSRMTKLLSAVDYLEGILNIIFELIIVDGSKTDYMNRYEYQSIYIYPTMNTAASFGLAHYASDYDIQHGKWRGNIRYRTTNSYDIPPSDEKYVSMFAHEILHVLGLDHVNDIDNIMFTQSHASLHMTTEQIDFVRSVVHFQCWAVFGEESGFCYGQYDEPWKAIGRKERIDHLNKKD